MRGAEAFGDVADQFEQQAREAATSGSVAADLCHGEKQHEALARARLMRGCNEPSRT